MNESNQLAWNQETYNAWVKRFGSPQVYAGKLIREPHKLLQELFEDLEGVDGKRILNLMGSNGNKAVALALLGARVTVVDFSEGNRKYAMELAKEAGVDIDYIVQSIETFKCDEPFDIVFAEMGILHYFQEINVFFNICSKVLKEGGLCIIRDFHPVSTKLISSRGSTAKVRKHKVDGDYFSSELVVQEVAYAKYLENDESATVFLRKWTLGEVVTGMATEGFIVESLVEAPNLSSENFDKGIPKTFTLKGTKALRLTE